MSRRGQLVQSRWYKGEGGREEGISGFWSGYLPPHRHIDDDQHEQGEGRHATAHDERHRGHGHLIHGLGSRGDKE